MLEIDCQKRPPSRWEKVQNAGLLLLSAFFLWRFLAVACSRMGYGFELEWMEGAMVDHVLRLRAGQPLFVEPSYDFVPFLYHPLYYYVATLVSYVVGPGFLALRLVSFLSTLGSALLLYRLVFGETRRHVPGLVAGGVFLACFSLAGGYYDIGRVDPLFTFLILLCVSMTRLAEGPRDLLAAAFAILLAWLCKQTAVVIVPFLLLGCLSGGCKRALVFGLGTAVLCGLTVWILDLRSGGWFLYYTFEVPRGHGVLEPYILGYWTRDLLALAPAGLLFLAFLLAALGAGRWRAACFHGAWILGCILGSYLSRIHQGGAENVLIPALAALSCALGLCLGEAGRSLAGGLMQGLMQGLMRVLVWGLVLLQFSVLLLLPFLEPVFGPQPRAPTEADRRAGEQLLEQLRREPGPVFLPWHGYLPGLVRKQPAASIMAIVDVLRSRNQEVIGVLTDSMREHLEAEPHPSVFMDHGNEQFLNQLLYGYEVKGSVFGPEQEGLFYPVVGTPLRPERILRKR